MNESLFESDMETRSRGRERVKRLPFALAAEMSENLK